MNVTAFWLGSLSASAISGGDRYALEVLQHWSAQGDEVSVVASSAGARLAETFGYSLALRRCEPRTTTIARYRLAYAGRFVRGSVAAMRAPLPEAIVSVSLYFYDLLPAAILALRARVRGRRALLIAPIFHIIPSPRARPGNPIVNTLAWLEQRFMIRFAAVACDLIVVDNAPLERELWAWDRAFVRKTFLSRMGVRSTVSQSNAAPAAAPAAYAVYVGRLSAAKGVEDLLLCWQSLAGRTPLALHLAGSLDASLDVPERIRSLGLDDVVHVHVAPSDAAVSRLVAGAYIAITASREEGYGLSVLESLASYVPTVTYDVPAFRDVFPAGREIARAFGAEPLAEAVLALVREPERRARLVADIRRSYAFDTWETIAAALRVRIVGALGALR